jgi:hypothetical protein
VFGALVGSSPGRIAAVKMTIPAIKNKKTDKPEIAGGCGERYLTGILEGGVLMDLGIFSYLDGDSVEKGGFGSDSLRCQSREKYGSG